VLAKALGVLQRATQSKRALVVVAGDLAHVGPAFGDARPLDPQAKQHLASADHKTLADLSRGDAASFFAGIQREGDSRRYCGLTPLYMALRLLGQATGHLTGYAQCPADEQFGSLVSVAGMVFSK
jgi:predicted class III extradiol MEMO1 family dioxygenase